MGPYLCADHHVLNDVVHMWDERGNVSIKKHHQCSAHIFTYIRVIVHRQMEKVLWRKNKSYKKQSIQLD